MRKAAYIFVGLSLVAGATLFVLVRRHYTPLPSADRVLIEKGPRRLTLLREGKVIKTYRVALGSNPLGHKQEEGDGRTPEGVYTIDFHKADSDYHLALHISYPNPADVSRANARGVSAGGDIMIHGLPNEQGEIGVAHGLRDWTAGCIAVTDREIEEIYRAVADGTPVEIRP